MSPTTPSDPGRTRAARSVGVAACLVGAALVYLLAVVTDAGQLAEYRLFQAVEASWGAPAGLRSRAVLLLAPAMAAAVTAAAVLALVPRADPRLRRRGVAALLVVGAANATAQLAKELLPRPDRANGVPWTAGNSLPSGHMAMALSAATAALLLAPPRWRPAVAVLGAGVTAFTGAAAYLEAWHRPSDMVAAVLVVLAWSLVATLLRGRRRAPGDARPTRGTAVRVLPAVLTGLGAAGSVAGVVLLALTLGAAAPAVAATALPAGVLLSASPAVLAVGVLATALRADDDAAGRD